MKKSHEITIIYTPTFAKHFRLIPIDIKKKAYRKESAFRNNPFNRILRTHKLSGKLNQYWSFSIDYHWRIVFRFVNKGEILFVDVGTHRIYR